MVDPEPWGNGDPRWLTAMTALKKTMGQELSPHLIITLMTYIMTITL
jgi:hypothetical protein